MNKEGKEIKEEIRKEFQLDRMILFSDAVFAIVITLMAIEIRLPHIEGEITNDTLITQILHVRDNRELKLWLHYFLLHSM